MPTEQAEPSSLAGLAGIGRQIADDAKNLVRDEIAVAKAQAKSVVVRFAAGIGTLVVAFAFLWLHLVFFLGTVAEGKSLSDNWSAGASLASWVALALGLALLSGAGWLKWPGVLLSGLGALGGLGFWAWFYIDIIFVSSQPRTGWAITASVFLILSVVSSAIGGWLLWRAWKSGKSGVNSFKEDVEWLKHLSKHSNSEN